MTTQAIVYADKLLNTPYAKTTHGLVRGSQRYNIAAVIDSENSGQDAGAVIDGIARNIPVFSTLSDALKGLEEKPEAFILGIAFPGGRIDAQLRSVLMEALENDLDLVSGLHTFLTDDEQLTSLADRLGKKLIDIRKPKPRDELHFWSGEITRLTTPIVAVLGTDCALGKRTTAKMITDELQGRGVNAQMIYTGQTGWLQGWKYGFIFDSTPNDFVCGELEHAILHCNKETNADVILLEGQSALRNPSGPCGAEFMLSGGARYVILQTSPTRQYYGGYENLELRQPSITSEIELIRAYGSEVIAVSLNTESLNEDECRAVQDKLKVETNLPVLAPMYGDITALADLVKNLT